MKIDRPEERIHSIFNLKLTDKLVGYFTEIRSFGDVLSDESIRVLIGSTFPRR